MKRAPSKKAIERRKRPRSAANSAKTAARAPSSRKLKLQATESIQDSPSPRHAPAARSAGGQVAVEATESCQNCARVLVSDDRALFVEEEVGRVFCSETCISTFFTPDIERLEKDYHRGLSQSDLSREERESYSHLRWITLQEPDEIWREKTLVGDQRYTLISEFQPGAKRIWCICLCLFLKGEPSFLYLAFTTKNAAMVNAYRRGERVEWAKPKLDAEERQARIEEAQERDARADENRSTTKGEGEVLSDRLADEWTDDETFLAQVNQERRDDDIPPEEFEEYQHCLEETLETPDEVWSCTLGKSSVKLYHFMRHYNPAPDDQEGLGYWYLIIARETDGDEEQIEVLDAFPTRDSALVDRYRRGDQEVGHTSPGPTDRVVH